MEVPGRHRGGKNSRGEARPGPPAGQRVAGGSAGGGHAGRKDRFPCKGRAGRRLPERPWGPPGEQGRRPGLVLSPATSRHRSCATEPGSPDPLSGRPVPLRPPPRPPGPPPRSARPPASVSPSAPQLHREPRGRASHPSPAVSPDPGLKDTGQGVRPSPLSWSLTVALLPTASSTQPTAPPTRGTPSAPRRPPHTAPLGAGEPGLTAPTGGLCCGCSTGPRSQGTYSSDGFSPSQGVGSAATSRGPSVRECSSAVTRVVERQQTRHSGLAELHGAAGTCPRLLVRPSRRVVPGPPHCSLRFNMCPLQSPVCLWGHCWGHPADKDTF